MTPFLYTVLGIAAVLFAITAHAALHPRSSNAMWRAVDKGLRPFAYDHEGNQK